MLLLTLKNFRANKVRFAMTTFGVMLAVSFVVSALVLGDGLRSTFGGIAEEATAGIDIQVRPEADFGDPPPLDAEMVGVVAAIDGVADAIPGLEAPWDAVLLLGEDGQPVTVDGPPHIGSAWSENPDLSAFFLVEGAAPSVGEFVVDLDAAAKHDLVIGQTYELVTPSGHVELALSGTSSFGEENGTVGAVLMQMNVAQAPELFGIDGVNTIDVQVANGADADEVQAAIAAALSGVDVVDHDTVFADSEKEMLGDINIIGNILLGFGGVSLFVSAFIIYNTFAIVLGQRIQELALLRTIGASPKQIRRSVLGEAFVVGVLASVGGLVGGIGVAIGLEALFNATGAALPDTPTIVATRTVVATGVIGIGITMLAALAPSRRAATVPAIAALRGGIDAGATRNSTRLMVGGGLVGVGTLAGLAGIAVSGSTAGTISLMGVGAIGIFLGAAMLSPLAVGPVTSVLGWPLAKVAGLPGRLAQENAARNPGRTATTAAALMIGLALVSTVMIVGESVKSTIGTTLKESATADYYVTDQLPDAVFPLGLSEAMEAEEVVDLAVGFRYVETRVDNEIGTNVAVDFRDVESVLNADVRTGSYDNTVANPVLISATHAAETGHEVGDIVDTEFANGSILAATIVGVFHDEALVVSNYLFDESVFDAAGDVTGYEWLAVRLVDDADPASVDLMLANVRSELPVVDLETTEAFQRRVESSIDEVLTMANVMVALAVIIALIGITNTLALSVFERTRELGLVRAVGMTRRQLRRMVRFEAAIVATFGAVLGTSIGVVFGWALVQALPTSIASTVAIPSVSIGMLVVIAALAGVVAAVLPARRAGRLDVLEAISH